jgi:hypothetical protein
MEKVGREQWEGRRREGKHTNSAVEGTLVSRQAPLTAFGREREKGKVGREIIEVGKMYRRRWAGKGGKGNTSLPQCGGVS